MGFSPLNIAPGIVKTDSPYSLKGRYIDSDKVRFVGGLPEKWAGYETLVGPLTGRPRKMLAWDDFAFNRWLAVGTSSKLYVINSAAVASNMTPIRSSGTLGNNPFAMTNASATVTVTHTAHGALVGDTVSYAGATAAAGITIDGDYLLDTLVDANTYTIIHSAPATSTASGGGAAVTYKYEITPGSPNLSQGAGYGTGRYGAGKYGVPRVSLLTATRYPRMWFLENYGEKLYALPSGYPIYVWNPNAATTRPPALANCPTANAMFMTNERVPVLLGVSGNPMQMAWPDRNNHTNWTPANDGTSTALFRELAFGSRLIGGTHRANFSSLIWTDTTCYTMDYTGAPNSWYTTLPAGHKCGLIGPNAFAIDGDGNAFWMSTFTFFMYSGGGVVEIPNVGDIHDWLFSRISPKQNFKCNAYYSPKYKEVRWHYILSGDMEASYYVAVSLADFSWSVGTYQRNAMAEQSGINAQVYGADNNGYIYIEDVGVDANGSAMPWFVESAPIDADGGNRLIDLWGIIPDFQRHTGQIDLTLTSWDKPQDENPLESQMHTISEGQGIADMHMSGRQISFRMDGGTLGGDFRLGAFRVDTGGESVAARR